MDRVARHRVAIALGSNLGDRLAHLEFALQHLHVILDNLVASEVSETSPVGVPDEQPPYLNAAVTGETALEPEPLLRRLHEIEQARGRERPSFRAARTLDVDLILYADRIIHAGGIDIPHPRFRDRLFVLEPLVEIAAGWIDPESGLTVAQLLSRAEGKGQRAKGGQK